jgi:type I restriction-modification system DNA methylase subunit
MIRTSNDFSMLDLACGSGSLLLNVRKCMGPQGIGMIYGQEKKSPPTTSPA